MDTINGVLVVDKPKGPTSFEVVRWVKKLTHQSRVGHAGTLDPMATGVLVVCVGETTKIVPYLMDAEKTYEATLRLGVTTDTDDAAPESKVIFVADPKEVASQEEEKIRLVLQGFVGEIMQIPPRFSALKKEGKRLYEVARVAKTPLEHQQLEQDLIEKQRIVSIYLISFVKVTVSCGKGTYIRSLARDIGNALGVGAHLTELRRTSTGSFLVDSAHPCVLEKEGWSIRPPFSWVSASLALSHLPVLLLLGIEEKQIRQGKIEAVSSLVKRCQVPLENAQKQGQPVRLVDEKGDLVAILVYEQNKWKIGRGFHSSC